MNKEIKEKWVAALRSGEYKQGVGFLRNADNTFCCLGVLCDLHSKDKGYEWPMGYTYMGEEKVLPSTVAGWAGLSNRNPIVMYTLFNKPDAQWNLAAVNDRRCSFGEIAEIIEEQL